MHPAGDDLVPCSANSAPGSAVHAAIPRTDDLESVRCPAGNPAAAAVQRAFAHLPSHVDSSPCRFARQSAGQYHDARALIEAERLPHAPATHHHPQPGLTHLHMRQMSHILSLSHPAGQMAVAAAAAADVAAAVADAAASRLVNGMVAADVPADQAGHPGCYTAVAQQS